MWNQIIEFVTTQIQSNELLAGGAVLGALGIIWTYLRYIPMLLLRWSRFLIVTELDIPDRTSAFHWVTDWLAQHRYMKRARRVSIQLKGEEDDDRDRIQMSPAPGWHLLWWHYRPMIIRRVRREGSADMQHKPFRETWRITVIGKRKHVDAFIIECKKVVNQEREKFIEVRESDEYGYWIRPDTRRKRPADSVLLPPGVMDDLMSDIHGFINSKDWYHEMHIPWRRGYLISGPPGNGKSSLITAVASEIGFQICTVNLKTTPPSHISNLLKSVPLKSILLLEDIDCVFKGREGSGDLDLSTLLNLIDGVNAVEGRLLFMTTNHPDKLDPALIRPGRVDKVLKLHHATRQQIIHLYNRFFPHAKNGSDFAARAIEYNPSMATVQGYLLSHRNDIRGARKNIREMADVQRTGSGINFSSNNPKDT